MSNSSRPADERSLQERRRQLAALLRKKAEKLRRFPTSFAQQRLWVLDQLDPGNPVYNVPLAIRLNGTLDREALNRTLNELVVRHESLRTRIAVEDGQPVQVVEAPQRQELPVIVLEHSDPSRREAEASARVMAEVRRPFRLDQSPLFHVSLLRLSPIEHILVVVLHHIISDDWSVGVLVREMVLLYQAFQAGRPSPLKHLEIQYADYAAWQRQRLQGETLQQLLDYWCTRLNNVSPLELPADQLRSLTAGPTGATESTLLPAGLADQLRDVARREGATLYMILLTAFQVLLGRYSGQEDFAVGSPVAGRIGRETESLVGCFVNTLVLRADLAGDPIFRNLLRQSRKTALEAFQYQELPFERLVERMNPDRNANRHPLFQVTFSLENAPWPDVKLAGLTFAALPLDPGTSKFDLSFSAREVHNGLAISAEYDSHLFERHTIKRMLKHFHNLLEGIVEDADLPISQLRRLDEVERQQLQGKWNESAGHDRHDLCVTELFEAQVKRTPEATALIDGPRQWTYRELNQRATRWAHYLQARGVGPNQLVAVRLKRSAELVMGMWAVLKAGGAYLPIDPQLPAERLRFILDDAQVTVVLTTEDLRSDLNSPPRHVICLDTDQQEFMTGPIDTPAPAPRILSDHLAYAIYTSGSTGRPNGVLIEHKALVNYTEAAATRYEITATDRVLQFASASFDAHVEEIYPCLTRGGTLLLRNDEMLDCRRFMQLCREWQLTFVSLPTGFWHELTATIAADGLTIPDTLRMLVIGGEPARPDCVAHWFQHVGDRVRLLNTYGPTETTVVATAAELNRADGRRAYVPIGRPLANCRTYVLDGHGQLVPVGVRGELCIGGESLARGYLNRPELTDKRFVPDPFNEKCGGRIYKTGDVVRWRTDGQLEYLGRTDHQVKIRGFRIELGEIESALRRQANVRSAVVMAQDGPTGGKLLLAYVVADPASRPTSAELRRFLGESLPDYMIPTAFVPLDAIPLNTNGKVDYKALPRPIPQRDEQSVYVPPRNPDERMLAEIWSDVLHVDDVGVHDNFFHLGGHSLLATQVASRIARRLSVDLPLREMFQSPTVAELAQRVEFWRRSRPKIERAPIKNDVRETPAPASYGQEELWTISQMQQGPSPYTIHPAALIRGSLDTRVLQQAVNEVWRRHETLRTTFADIEGRLVQVVAPYEEFHLAVVDLSGLPAQQRDAEVQRQITDQSRRPLDLTRGPLAQVELLRLGNDEHVVLLGMHHIIYDGWSLEVLSRELLTAYLAFSAGLPPQLPELPIQYADFAVWQRERLQGDMLDGLRGYWLEQLDGLPPLELPADRARPAVLTTHAAQCVHPLSSQLSRAIGQLNIQEETTTFMTLLAAFQTLLHRYSGQTDFAVGTPVAGRLLPETENLIGYFVNDLVLRADLSGNPSFRELLGRVRETVLRAFEHQELPFARLVQEMNPRRDPGRHPLIQTELVFQNTPPESHELPGLQMSWLKREAGAHAAELDLSMEAYEHERGIQVSMTYRTDLFDQTAIARMLEQFQAILEEVVAAPDRRLSELAPHLLPPLRVDAHPQIPSIYDSASATAKIPYRAARTFAEQQLAAIWARVLGLDRVGIDDNFFELGGSSLMAVRMMTQARTVLDADLPFTNFFIAPTVAALAKHFETAARAESERSLQVRSAIKDNTSRTFSSTVDSARSLICLRAEGSGSSLFCIHGVGGHIASFGPLARCLTQTRTIYGLQGQGLVAGQPPHDRIEDMAAAYLNEIQEVQTGEPYRLAGWSMGGLIALEAARLLTAAGAEVALVAMFDTDFSADKIPAQDMDQHSVMRWLAPLLNIPVAELKQLPLDRQWEWIANDATLFEGKGAAEIGRLVEVCRAHLAALANYVPKPYDGRVTLFQSNSADRLDSRWNSLFPRLRVESVPGNHYTMLRPPHVVVLAERLDHYLTATMAAGEMARVP